MWWKQCQTRLARNLINVHARFSDFRQIIIVPLESSWLLQTIAQPQLRESPAYQAVIPDKIGDPPAPVELPLRWEAGPSFEEAMASARGPEKAAADLLPLDATFDPETHEGAGELAMLHHHPLLATIDSTLCLTMLPYNP